MKLIVIRRDGKDDSSGNNVITKELLSESTVTDEMIKQFESEMDVTIPKELVSYLKSYCHSVKMLCAAVPDNLVLAESDIMQQMSEMTQEEIVDEKNNSWRRAIR